jgi:fumarate reductase (CoM/CoB) subunit B
MKTEEYSEVDKCTTCGMCRTACPTFRAMKTEANSPRGKAIFMKKGVDDEIFYKCTLCGACKQKCPTDVNLGLKAHRETLAGKGVQTEANKKMIENVRKHGNPFGDPDKDSESDDLYCC